MAASWLVNAFQADLTVCCKTPRRRKRRLEEGVRNGRFWVNLGAGIRSGSTMTATRRLTAILAADVAGYSRLMGADEEGTHESLKAHLRKLVNPKITEHRGRVVKNTGDGFLAEFASVVDAIRCAVEVRRGMADREPEVPDARRIRVRIGVNLGDVITMDDLARDDAEFEATPILRISSADERVSALRALLDFMRKGLAVECDALDRLKIESLAGRMRSVIKAPWILDEEHFLAAPVFMSRPPTRREMRQKDEELI